MRLIAASLQSCIGREPRIDRSQTGALSGPEVQVESPIEAGRSLAARGTGARMRWPRHAEFLEWGRQPWRSAQL